MKTKRGPWFLRMIAHMGSILARCEADGSLACQEYKILTGPRFFVYQNVFLKAALRIFFERLSHSDYMEIICRIKYK